ncbi:MAG: nicotinate-nucleotide--dimethylbenzimidazole phosphoribosyltransferase [Oscillospiraceae bacterium]|nr:nicotinate-nucleotide--dimethylbenzimidazole phosphoribosyltransferase [Oscillospiraceae bacterium]
MQYSEDRLISLIDSVSGPDAAAERAAEELQSRLAKPPGSLGMLEELSVRLAGMTGRVKNEIRERYLLVFCADNGVVRQGVASSPQSVTLAQTINLTKGKTGAAVLAENFGVKIRVCDVGVNAEIYDPDVIGRKIAYGTEDITQGPAMSREQAVRAILTGADLAAETADMGAQVIGVGEMGIGNTTTSSAVLSVLTGSSVKDITGRGAGLTDEAYEKKIKVITDAIALNDPDPDDVIGTLAKVGGFDIAAMTGAFIGAAYKKIPAVIDGFISVVAALCAYRLCPESVNYMVTSHSSYEVGYRTAVEALGLKPLFDLGMRLGEGSGCPIAMMILDAACAVINNMATFEEAEINDSYLDEIRNTDAFSVKGKDT